jgi:hypothetical protein
MQWRGGLGFHHGPKSASLKKRWGCGRDLWAIGDALIAECDVPVLDVEKRNAHNASHAKLKQCANQRQFRPVQVGDSDGLGPGNHKKPDFCFCHGNRATAFCYDF